MPRSMTNSTSQNSSNICSACNILTLQVVQCFMASRSSVKESSVGNYCGGTIENKITPFHNRNINLIFPSHNYDDIVVLACKNIFRVKIKQMQDCTLHTVNTHRTTETRKPQKLNLHCSLIPQRQLQCIGMRNQRTVEVDF